MQESMELGAVYTPYAVAEWLTSRVLQPLTGAASWRPGLILDPACGDGVFLEAAWRQLWLTRPKGLTPERAVAGERGAHRRQRCDSPHAQTRDAQTRLGLLESHIRGIDIDPGAVAAARRRLAALLPAAFRQTDHVRRVLEHCVQQGDVLLPGRDCQTRERGGKKTHPAGHRAAAVDGAGELGRWFPEAGRRGGVDVVLANPPYLNIRQIARRFPPDYRAQLRARFSCARGAFDLYVLFLQLACRWCRTGGRSGFVVPNKLGALAYAEPCRELLATRTRIEQIVDASQCSLFPDTHVYPYLFVFQHESPPAEQQVEILEWMSEGTRRGGAGRRAARRGGRGTSCAAQLGGTQPDADAPLAASGASPVVRLGHVGQATLRSRGWAFHAWLACEPQGQLVALAELARIDSGTAGFAAEQIARQLVESAAPTAPSAKLPPAMAAEATDAGFEFIVSGNIDRYEIAPGNVRFMKRRFRQPRLPRGAHGLTARKALLFAGPKLVVAGMTRRLEVAYDAGGFALGVQVYALSEFRDDPYYLLGVLNSEPASHLFRNRYRAKLLAGGYLAVNKAQLSDMPIPQVDAQSPAIRQSLHRLVACLAERRLAPSAEVERQQLERRIDRAVWRLYGIPRKEQTRFVEATTR